MPLEVDSDGLRAAAGILSMLPTDIDNAPKLDAQAVSKKLSGLAVGTALGQSDPASRQAKDVLKARFDEFAASLALAAENFQGTDMDAAQRLAGISDLNSGDPHAGK